MEAAHDMVNMAAKGKDAVLEVYANIGLFIEDNETRYKNGLITRDVYEANQQALLSALSSMGMVLGEVPELAHMVTWRDRLAGLAANQDAMATANANLASELIGNKEVAALIAAAIIIKKSKALTAAIDKEKNKPGFIGDRPQNIYNSIKDAPKYPNGFQAAKNGTIVTNVNNKGLLEKLREVEPGDWKKVYKNGYDAQGREISIHYFQSHLVKYSMLKLKTSGVNKHKLERTL